MRELPGPGDARHHLPVPPPTPLGDRAANPADVQRPIDAPQTHADSDTPAAASPLGELPKDRTPSAEMVKKYPERPVNPATHAGAAAVEAAVAGDPHGRPTSEPEGQGQPALPADARPTPDRSDHAGPPPPPDNPIPGPAAESGPPPEPDALQTFKFLASGGGHAWNALTQRAAHMAIISVGELDTTLSTAFPHGTRSADINPNIAPTLSEPIKDTVRYQLDDPYHFAGVLESDCAAKADALAAFANGAEERPLVVASPPTKVAPHYPMTFGQYQVTADQQTLHIAETEPPENPDAAVQPVVYYADGGGTVQFIHPDGTSRDIIAPRPDGSYTHSHQEVVTIPLGTATYLRALRDRFDEHAELLMTASAYEETVVPEGLKDNLHVSAAALLNLLGDSSSYILAAEDQPESGLAQVGTSISRYFEAVESKGKVAENIGPTSLDRFKIDLPTRAPNQPEINSTRLANGRCDTLLNRLQDLGIARELTPEAYDQQVEHTRAAAAQCLAAPGGLLSQIEACLIDSRFMEAYTAIMRGHVVRSRSVINCPSGESYTVGQYTMQPTEHGIRVDERPPDETHTDPFVDYYDPLNGTILLVNREGTQRWHIEGTNDGELSITIDSLHSLARGTDQFFIELTVCLERHAALLREAMRGEHRPDLQARLEESLLTLDILCNETTGDIPMSQPSLNQVAQAAAGFTTAVLATQQQS